MPSSLDAPHGTALAAIKGLTIASSLLFAGHLATVTLQLPSLYISAETSHRLAAQQFTHQYRATKKTAPPCIVATGLAYGALAYLALREGGGRGSTLTSTSTSTVSRVWKLWAGAAAATFAVIPFTVALMEPPTRRLLWVGEVADSATKTVGPPASTGIGVKVVDHESQSTGNSTAGAGAGANGSLGLPSSLIDATGPITPIEEFEPFEDAIVGEEYEQLKVKKLLQKFAGYNFFKALLPLVAGGLGMTALFLE